MARVRTQLMIVFSVLVLGSAAAANAQDKLERIEGDEQTTVETFAWLPYVFYTANFKLAFGAGAASYGYGQPQLSLAGTAFATTNGSWGILANANNLRLRSNGRLFMDVIGGYIRYAEKDSYVSGNPDFPDEQAGSNDSSKANFLDSPARNGFVDVRLRYLLPIGFGRDTIINTFVVQDGILVSGSTGGWTWDPTISGRTYLGLDFFYNTQTLTPDSGDRPYNTNGFTFTLEYDNTDFWLNPTRGSRQLLWLTRDFGLGNSSGSWTMVELEVAKFIDLGSSRAFRQSVIALDLWTADTLSGRAPFYEGPRLGGLNRLRGYRQNRFHDLSAIYYCAELRVIPDWSPLNSIDHIGPITFNWWQFVAFVEVGRVSPTYNLRELHSRMKADVGVGLRTLIKSAVVRADVGFSHEGWQLSAMAGHTF